VASVVFSLSSCVSNAVSFSSNAVWSDSISVVRSVRQPSSAVSAYDDRLKSLQDLARDAEAAMRDLADDAWPSAEARDRCLGVFAYSRVVLETSDGALLSDQAFQLISNAISQFSGGPPQAAQNADPWSSALLDAVAALPVARDRAVEQAVKDAAANFQRAAQQRLNAFDQDVTAARADLEALKTTIDTRKAELATAIDERKGEIAGPNRLCPGRYATQRASASSSL
jgi:hypothetical protein